MNENDLWNFVYWDEFSEIVYSQTLNKSHLMGKGSVQHQDALHSVDNLTGKSKFYDFERSEDHYFYKMCKGDEFYLLPKRFYDKLPMIPTKWIDMKLKSSDSTVWRFIQEFDSFRIPEIKTMDLAGYIKQFNPVKHNNPAAATILKCIAIAKGLKLAVCASYHCGKNMNYQIKAAIQNNVVSGMKNKTEAMFYKLCLFNDDLNIDEITTWTPQKIQAIEDKLAVYGDQSTKDQKHAIDNNKKNEVIKNIYNKSFIITFNPYDEKRHKKYFGENMGNPGKIKDRYPFIYLKGEVLDAPAQPVQGTEISTVENHISFYQKQASEFMYWRNNYYKHLHGYDRSKLCFKDVRKLRNISPLIDVIDVMSISQDVFDYWIDVINQGNTDYNRMYDGQESVYANISQVILASMSDDI